MRVEKQGYQECTLAVIAALSDTPLAEVRDVACAKAHISYWAEMLNKPVAYQWAVMRYLVRRYKASGVSATPVNLKASIPTAQITLDGRGTIVIGVPNDRNSHIMPFENGLIYDLNDPNNPFPLKDLGNKYPQWPILRVKTARKKRLGSRNKNQH